MNASETKKHHDELEDQYHPLGLKAVKAAAELESSHLKAVKEKPEKKQPPMEFED